MVKEKLKTDITYIRLTKKTRDVLAKLRLTKRESYEEIIIRLMKNENL